MIQSVLYVLQRRFIPRRDFIRYTSITSCSEGGTAGRDLKVPDVRGRNPLSTRKERLRKERLRKPLREERYQDLDFKIRVTIHWN